MIANQSRHRIPLILLIPKICSYAITLPLMSATSTCSNALVPPQLNLFLGNQKSLLLSIRCVAALAWPTSTYPSFDLIIVSDDPSSLMRIFCCPS